jgi:hypothetical protein
VYFASIFCLLEECPEIDLVIVVVAVEVDKLLLLSILEAGVHQVRQLKVVLLMISEVVEGEIEAGMVEDVVLLRL